MIWSDLLCRPRELPDTNSQQNNRTGLDKRETRSKIPEIPRKPAPHCSGTFRIMTSKPTPSPQNVSMKQPCKHPRVQIVSRDEEAEFVECKECGEIFESSEFKDMNIEEQTKDADI
jgi:hypothetical protein